MTHDELLNKYPNATNAQIQMAELSESYWRKRNAQELLDFMNFTFCLLCGLSYQDTQPTQQ